MKKLFSTIVISALLCVNTFATPVVVNSEPATFEKPVIIRQSTSFLSLREIASNLLDNVNLQWNAENKTAILTSNNITVQVPIGTNYIIVNDNTRPIDANNSQVTSFIENGTTYVPIRCIAESFGYVVNYSDNTIYVSNKDCPSCPPILVPMLMLTATGFSNSLAVSIIYFSARMTEVVLVNPYP